MNVLLEALKRNQRRGSKPRCHVLTQGTPEVVAARLSALVEPFARVGVEDNWLPQGFVDVAEATLPEASTLLDAKVRVELQQWWLSAPSAAARTPNWDIASTCTIEGKRGIVLVEAKAHEDEIIKEETGRKAITPPVSADARRNLMRIDWAIRDANAALASSTGLVWALSRDWNYQMSNRFAWAWKLADLGVPVVLVYLGLLRASEMTDKSEQFRDAAHWEAVVRQHSEVLFPPEVWGQRFNIKGQPLVALIQSLEIPLAGIEAQDHAV